MTDIDKKLKEILPSLRKIAPQTFWFSAGFGVFNVLIGLALILSIILLQLVVISVIPLKVWGVVFLIHGILMLYSLIINNWNLTKYLNIVGIGIKTAWWLELLSITIFGRPPFLLLVWSLLLFLQFIVCVYFTPRIKYAK